MYSSSVTAGLPRVLSLSLAVLLSGAGRSASADVVTTTDGKTYEGRVVSQTDGRVVIDTTFDGTKEFDKTVVKAIDTSVPPLREQFAFRLGQASDVPSLVALADWAKGRGFKAEILDVWRKVVAADPSHVKAHKALGHVLVGKVWMTPEEKAAAEAAAAEAALRAKGLVPHAGRWVTPAEKAALEKGLLKDGDDWVTEEEFHLRRGESKVDGAWIRVGEAAAKARGALISKDLGTTLKVEWAPHVDMIHDLEPADAKGVLDATERAAAAFHRLMKPGPSDRLDGVRIGLHCFSKAPLYARFCEFFAKEADLATLPGFEGWGRQAGRIRGFWWPKPGPVIGSHLFPYTPANLASFTSHDAVLSLISRYRFTLKRVAPPWVAEGLAYALELEANGGSETFVVGRGGIAGGGDPGPWQDSKRWRDALKAAVVATQDTPFARLSGFAEDQLQLPDLVKSWSVIDYLLRLDRARFKPYMDGLKDKDKSPEDALKDAYALDPRGLESRWRSWVEGGFTGP